MSSPAQAHGSSSPGPSTSLTNRYGRPKRRLGRRASVLAVIVGLVVVTLVVLLLTVRSHRSYSPDDVSFDVVSSRRTDVTVAMTMKPHDTVSCGVQVLSEDHGVVGYREVDFVGSTGEDVGGGNVVVQHKVRVRTVFEGVNGGASVCWKH